MHGRGFSTHSYRHWVTDNAINRTGERIMELKNCENRTVVVLQAEKNKPTGGITGKKEAEEVRLTVQTD